MHDHVMSVSGQGVHYVFTSSLWHDCSHTSGSQLHGHVGGSALTTGGCLAENRAHVTVERNRLRRH